MKFIPTLERDVIWRWTLNITILHLWLWPEETWPYRVPGTPSSNPHPYPSCMGTAALPWYRVIFLLGLNFLPPALVTTTIPTNHPFTTDQPLSLIPGTNSRQNRTRGTLLPAPTPLPPIPKDRFTQRQRRSAVCRLQTDLKTAGVTEPEVVLLLPPQKQRFIILSLHIWLGVTPPSCRLARRPCFGT